MRNLILGTVAGLLVGSAGALAYSHFAGDGNALADLQSQLNDANAKLAKAQSDMKFLKEQYNSETDQLNQVLASKQQPAASDAGQASAAPAAIPLTVGGVQITPDMIRGFMGMMRGGGPGGGFRSPEQRMFLLQSRLKLDPDQAKAIKDAMDADQQARRDLFRQSRQNGQMPDPSAMAAINSLEKTMSSVLSPSQQVQYQQLQSDEKQARAESAATQQVDNMMPLLQLNDDQKGKLMNALYQQQLTAPDPGSLVNNPNPMGAMAQQGQAIQSAMKQVLNTDQLALYQQSEQVQQQAFANGGGGRRGNRGNGGAGGQGQAAGGVAGNAPATASTATTTSASGTTTDMTAATTNAASATTNAASATPPSGT
jgi:hypothetical protein